ncbi:hypothetical protein HUO14_10240 [Parasphingorhabdus flavimaris]|uniref:Uncharacterized protein n=1 Tax=Parasphingorhabdus flavimaris TaxID=266812 RepID=A0ABX2N3J9_9SPHN|nr:hypothetical protein [Parasphingorhabdus flavimaris]NVD28283.1 hypothetical protein [Parasphingorhabdus flavimaris]
MTSKLIIRSAAFAAFTLAPVAALAAQDAPQSTDEIVVPANTAAASSGRIAVNIASGDNNQQLGDAAIAIGDIALVTETAIQRLIGPAPTDHITSITIEDGAFAGTNGLTSINITAGSQNQMANLAALAIGNNGAMSDQLLEQTRAPIEPKGGSPEGALPSNDRIAIGDTAFGNGNGLIQVNLIGGEGNSSANTFALSIASDGSP